VDKIGKGKGATCHNRDPNDNNNNKPNTISNQINSFLFSYLQYSTFKVIIQLFLQKVINLLFIILIIFLYIDKLDY